MFSDAYSFLSSVVPTNIQLPEVLPRQMQYLNDIMANRDDYHADKKDLLCVSFNQDHSALAVGHDEGYTLYHLRSIENLEKAHEGKSPKKTCIVERLFSSSLICLVSLNHTRKLQVYHYQKDNEICTHAYPSAILSIRMNRKRVVVCLDESIHVHNIRDMRLLHMIKDTPPNPLGLIDLSANEQQCYLAYPGSSTNGHVHIFDAESLVATCSIGAHEAPLAAMKFNSDASKLATASVKGTVIRVFAVPSGERLFEFTRGMKRCVTIHSLAFSVGSKFLCSSSNTETVHIFSLTKPEAPKEQAKEEGQEGIGAWVNYFSQQASAYLPAHMNELMLREKSFATARLPMVGTKTVVGMPRINNTDYLVVASADGYLFCYTIEPEGGECTLMRQYRIGPTSGAEQCGSSIPIGTKPSNVGPSANTGGQLYPQLPKETDLAKPPSSSSIPIQASSAAAQRVSASPSGSAASGSSIGAVGSAGSSSTAPQPKKRVTPPPVPQPPSAAAMAAAKSASPGKPRQRKDSESSNSSSDASGTAPGGLADLIPSKRGGGSDTDDIVPPADLNDLDEFPPLSHAI